MTEEHELKEEFVAQCLSTLKDATFIRLTLGKCHAAPALELISAQARLVTIKGRPALSIEYFHRTKSITKNLPLREVADKLRKLIGVQFRSATLFSIQKDLILEYGEQQQPRLRSSPPSLQKQANQSHDHGKNYLVPLQAPYLQKLGIVDSHGQLRPSGGAKFRQINKFVEIVHALIPTAWSEGRTLPRIIDFGSGKSYLTFALYDYLTSSLRIQCEMIGVEVRPELVAEGNSLAEECGFTSLRFVSSAAKEFQAATADLVVALHACDTATDDALMFAIKAKAEVIVVAPCCHKYIRKHMQLPQPYLPVFKHGILEERLAESLTDGLRALFLELHGYKAKVFEFISLEHTSKNIMITAQRSTGHLAHKQEVGSQISSLRQQFGISDMYLRAQTENKT